MIPPLFRPRRKNPILRTRQPLLPPGARSRAALGLTAAAALGRFELQVCARCGAVQYPPREACHRCLVRRAAVARTVRARRTHLSTTVVHHSHDPFFRERVPWRLGLVRLDAGPTVVAHLHAGCAAAPSRVRVGARLDKSGQGVLLAFPLDEVPNMADDLELREMTCDPKFRKVLVTDGKTARRPGLGAGPDRRRRGFGLGGLRRAVEAIPRVVRDRGLAASVAFAART